MSTRQLVPLFFVFLFLFASCDENNGYRRGYSGLKVWTQASGKTYSTSGQKNPVAPRTGTTDTIVRKSTTDGSPCVDVEKMEDVHAYENEGEDIKCDEQGNCVTSEGYGLSREDDGYYYPSNVSGDTWGVGTRLPLFFTLQNIDYDRVGLYRSSYGAIAPVRCQHGCAMVGQVCPICSSGQGFSNYGMAAGYIDRGLACYERGDRDCAYKNFTNSQLYGYCGNDPELLVLLKNLKDSVVSSATGIAVNTAHGILDRFNVRYGCRTQDSRCY